VVGATESNLQGIGPNSYSCKLELPTSHAILHLIDTTYLTAQQRIGFTRHLNCIIGRLVPILIILQTLICNAMHSFVNPN